jgi:hypothetical protein
MNALYVYGIINQENVDIEVTGVDGADDIRSVSHRPFSAVVSPIDTLEPEETDENSKAHDRVLQALLDDRTVIPMRFGMVFKDERTLKGVMREARPVFTRTMREIKGAVELGLKLIEKEEANVDREAVRADVEARLDGRARSTVENELFSDRLVLNRSYLVDGSRREEFSETINGIESEYEDLLVQYTGPWAPYNFVDIEIKGQ